MNLYRLFAVCTALAIAWVAAGAIASSDDPVAISLRPGYNAVTWNGSEPYPIADFVDTPVTKIHRWDAVGQGWLSHVLGRDGATLPELHLLPRVQYLLIAKAEHELEVPDPVGGIDPHARLRFAAPPDDPLRFEAYWPNEDSPLEDLILLRSDDERLSVRAEVAGGTDKIDVYWVLDGRLNHQGLASDDVQLLPGKHDEAMLYSADRSGQAVVVELPRVVKLPQVEIPEMVYGVNDWDMAYAPAAWEVPGHSYGYPERYKAAMAVIADLGFEYVRFAVWTRQILQDASLAPGRDMEHLDWIFRQLNEAGLQPLPILGMISPNDMWMNASDVSRTDPIFPIQRVAGGPISDHRLNEIVGQMSARRWPEIRIWQVSNEPSLIHNNADLDPALEVAHQKALALGIWYENPNAIVIGASPCCFWAEQWDGGIHGLVYLEAMYERGYSGWFDILGLHASPGSPANGDPRREIDAARQIMARYGDDDKPIWITETPAWYENEEQFTNFLVDHLRLYTDHPHVQGALIWKFKDTVPHPDQPDHWTEQFTGIVDYKYRSGGYELQPSGIAVRDFLRSLSDE